MLQLTSCRNLSLVRRVIVGRFTIEQVFLQGSTIRRLLGLATSLCRENLGRPSMQTLQETGIFRATTATTTSTPVCRPCSSPWDLQSREALFCLLFKISNTLTCGWVSFCECRSVNLANRWKNANCIASIVLVPSPD
ncbi:unnamed protein product [Heligmosomoides polygyrus]|uniref:Secreted protein n=1 Tax=Heligmosomoides polygyrus TaxID=6339 RepID=A0A183F5L0_HELPZ|nr:unnamed protein product [Heligmosomoides polygyrus]